MHLHISVVQSMIIEKKMKYSILFIILIFLFVSCNRIEIDDEIIINMKLNSQLIVIPTGQEYANYDDFDPSIQYIKEYFQTVSDSIVFKKLFPNVAPKDTIWVDRNGELKILNDWSQVFVIRIYNSSITQHGIINKLNSFEEIQRAEPPAIINTD